MRCIGVKEREDIEDTELHDTGTEGGSFFLDFIGFDGKIGEFITDEGEEFDS